MGNSMDYISQWNWRRPIHIIPLKYNKKKDPASVALEIFCNSGKGSHNRESFKKWEDDEYPASKNYSVNAHFLFNRTPISSSIGHQRMILIYSEENYDKTSRYFTQRHKCVNWNSSPVLNH